MDIRKLFAKREQQAEPRGEPTLDTDELEDEESSQGSEKQSMLEIEPTFVADVLSRHTHGCMSSRHQVGLANLQWKACNEVASQPFALPQHPALRDAAPMLPVMSMPFGGIPRGHSIISTQLDSQGELVLSATASGKVALHDFHMLRRCSTSRIQDEESQYRGLDPLLLLETSRRLAKVRWHPTNDNLFAAVAGSDRCVYLYDAQYTQGAPYQALSVPNAIWSGIGLTDVLLTPQGPYTAMASAYDGHIYLWDGRGGSAPRAKLGVSLGMSVNSLQLSQDSNLLLAGTLPGDVVGYDLRGGSSTAMSFGTQSRHPVVMEVGIRQALMQLQELRQQTSIGRSSVQSIDLDPKDSNRLAFHLASGWSGVLDLMSQTVSHVYCPPAQDDSLTGWGSGGSASVQQPCWTPSGTSYCLGDASGTGLSIVDFHPSRHSPCHLGGCNDDSVEIHAKLLCQHHSVASAVTIPVSSAVNTVAIHPDTDEIIAGTETGALLLLSA